MGRLLFVLFVAISLFNGHGAEAHTRSQSFSTWSIEESRVSYIFAVDARRVTQLAPIYNEDADITSLLEKHLKNTILIRINNQPCPLIKFISIGEGRAVRQARGIFDCPTSIDSGVLEVSISSFFSVSADPCSYREI